MCSPRIVPYIAAGYPMLLGEPRRLTAVAGIGNVPFLGLHPISFRIDNLLKEGKYFADLRNFFALKLPQT
jgi:hypothetical protein